jgi:hypothetical protein
MLQYLGGVHCEVVALLAEGKVLLRALPQQGVTLEVLRGLGWYVYNFPLPSYLGGGKAYKLVHSTELEALMASGAIRELSVEDREKSRPQK